MNRTFLALALTMLATDVSAQKSGSSTTFYSPGGSVAARAVTAPSGWWQRHGPSLD
jgi:hypothetical protein